MLNNTEEINKVLNTISNNLIALSNLINSTNNVNKPIQFKVIKPSRICPHCGHLSSNNSGHHFDYCKYRLKTIRNNFLKAEELRNQGYSFKQIFKIVQVDSNQFKVWIHKVKPYRINNNLEL